MPFSRLDPGMATPVDWAPHREAVLEERNQSWPDLPGNQVFLDLVIDGKIEQTMRLVFALFLDEVPLAAANFHALCVQRFDGLGECGKPLCYRRSPIKRIVKGQYIEGGDITGTGGDSIYGKNGFEDEPLGLKMKHNGPGLLTMANEGPDSNTSNFMVTIPLTLIITLGLVLTLTLTVTLGLILGRTLTLSLTLPLPLPLGDARRLPGARRPPRDHDPTPYPYPYP